MNHKKVPKEDLLIWNVKDGWEPLCEFLKFPVPQKPISHHDVIHSNTGVFSKVYCAVYGVWKKSIDFYKLTARFVSSSSFLQTEEFGFVSLSRKIER